MNAETEQFYREQAMQANFGVVASGIMLELFYKIDALRKALHDIAESDIADPIEYANFAQQEARETLKGKP